MKQFLIQDGKVKYGEMTLSERCELLEKMCEVVSAEAQSESDTDEVMMTFTAEIARDILLQSQVKAKVVPSGESDSVLSPLHVLSVLDSLIKVSEVVKDRALVEK